MISRMSHLLLALTLGSIFLFLLCLLFVLPVRAIDPSSVIVVENTNDSGPGSLRGAIDFAVDGSTIVFNSSLNGQTITLTSGELLITKTLTISGPGANLLAISGDNTSRVFNITSIVTISGVTIKEGASTIGGGILNSSGTVTLTNTTVSSNIASDSGGGIFNSGGSVTLTNTTVSSNTASSSGGGILNFFGTVTLTNTTVSSNTASSSGGGIFNDAGTVTLTNSTVSSNTAAIGVGGGIANNNGTVNLTNSTVSSNTATIGVGGSIANDNGTVNLTNSTVASNTASSNGGGIWNSGTVHLTNSTVSSNTTSSTGGGIFNSGDGGGGTINLTNSTVSGNMATTNSSFVVLAGGILNDRGSVTLTNSTVASNTATSGAGGSGDNSAGGILNDRGSVTLTNSTVSGNTATTNSPFVINLAGGILSNLGSVTLTNSTVSGNMATTNSSFVLNLAGGMLDQVGGIFILINSIVANSLNGRDCTGTIISFGYSLDSDNTCFLGSPGDISGVDPLLGPLADNGGDTLTHALLDGSPAIDHIPNGTNGCGTTITTDQRGISRPQGSNCDMGAYESTSPADLSISKSVTPITVSTGQPFTYTITISNVGAGNMTEVVISDTLPVSLTFVASSTTNGSSYNHTGGVWNVGSVTAGTNVVLTVVVTTSLSTDQTITNTAVLSASTPPDSSAGNNSDAAGITIGSGSTTYLPLILKN